MSLRIQLNQYMASNRWEEIYELNETDFMPLKNANLIKDEEWAALTPIHLLISCLPEKKFDPRRHQPAGREVGRRQFSEGGMHTYMYVYYVNFWIIQFYI